MIIIHGTQAYQLFIKINPRTFRNISCWISLFLIVFVKKNGKNKTVKTCLLLKIKKNRKTFNIYQENVTAIDISCY